MTATSVALDGVEVSAVSHTVGFLHTKTTFLFGLNIVYDGFFICSAKLLLLCQHLAT